MSIKSENLHPISESDSDDDELLLLLLLKTRLMNKNKLCVHKKSRVGEEKGEYQRMCIEFKTNEDRFFDYFHMSKADFEELHELLSLQMKKYTCWTHITCLRERLAVCLRHLITGDSYLKIGNSFHMRGSTVANIVATICKMLSETLQPIYMATPTPDIWKRSEEGFRDIWHFPNCVGCIDAKKIYVRPFENLKNPSNNPSTSANDYIILLSVIDPYYKFIVVDISPENPHNSNIENLELYQKFLHGKEILPSKPLPGLIEPVPHVLLGDEAFVLKENILRSCEEKKLTERNKDVQESQRVFNKRLLYTRQVVERTLVTLIYKWEILKKPLPYKVETVIEVLRAATCLHNFLITKHGYEPISIPEDTEISTGVGFASIANQRPHPKAYQVRTKFISYFNGLNGTHDENE